ncbi:MAG: hypothetical protein ACRDYX_10315 [Egibacteraceae bacterium]
MSAPSRSPFRVVSTRLYYEVRTPCCTRAVRLPRDVTDLTVTQDAPCAKCDLAWRVSFLSDPRDGLHASWSLPKKRPRPLLPRPPAQRLG